MQSQRRQFLKLMGGLAIGATGVACMNNSSENKSDEQKNAPEATNKQLFFEISLAQWSLHKALFEKKMDNLDFAAKARKDFGIGVVEYVNQFFKDKAKDTAYLNEMLKRCSDNEVKNHLIMIDGEGEIGHKVEAERIKAVENHYKWVDAAKHLGCATIRVNAAGQGTAEEIAKTAADGLTRLGEYAEKVGINVIVENHGGYSSNGAWLAGVMKAVNKPNVGTLPDFGNFCIQREEGNWRNCLDAYDRYQGTQELMPYAKGVSAKSHDFDEQGNEKETDYTKMLQIVKAAGFKGYIGIEYEGEILSEDEGIRKTKALLEKAGALVS
ncbi:sugar phosphate isomerase/epimerase family protein [Flavihumibacter sp. CACIAM 22H1]|uniref:sugar phosphate isomerase/epimerase family protein n=1 Tax=Flavihumibacter sp. CACIAM 22H1 TaxID=1812911 RepID=UPI0007A9347A|nr:sugar phosphate isomerase/epimerase family protein [Flavihumibacter sp. CACIAM 22H1]KYP13286.1 MAG: xylose isomerase [Flavihumibacter sp. CACIAM 22H1]